MATHETAPIFLWRTALGGTVATEPPTTAHDTFTYAAGHEPPASDGDSDADTPTTDRPHHDDEIRTSGTATVTAHDSDDNGRRPGARIRANFISP